MKARPILFNSAMVRALLSGHKTQTRRLCKPAANLSEVVGIQDPSEPGQRPLHIPGSGWFGDAEGDVQFFCPYGKRGDQLWVRETWSHDAESLEECRASHEDAMGGGMYGPYYFATEVAPDTLRWKPSIHMPRWASRITLEVTNVRVERLTSITEADAIAEGIRLGRDGLWNGAPHAVKGTPRAFHTPIGAYDDLWTHINGPESWAQNPWVWVVEFKVIKPATPYQTL